MKGPNVGPEIETAVKEWGYNFELEKNIEYTLPETSYARRLVIFRKIRPVVQDAAGNPTQSSSREPVDDESKVDPGGDAVED